VGDSWYAEGSTAGYQQAEVEYKDFITFFPNLPEAAEAQLKIASMHYKEMEKADRDFTHAMRAEDEYRQLILQYPDSKLVPEAKQRLREVQEVLAERQYRIGRFYFLRESYPAAEARLKTLIDTYPLYSQADDALMMLGRCYEAQAEMLKNPKLKLDEKMRVTAIRQYQGFAGQNYAHVIERYPLSDRADEARSRLKEFGLPIPTPTKEAIAQYKAEEQSRSEMGRMGTIMSTFHKAPDDLVRASKTGEPTLVDPQQTSAPQIIRTVAATALGAGNSGVNIEKATPGGKSDPIPHSQPSAGPAPVSAPDQPATTSPQPAATSPQPEVVSAQPASTSAQPAAVPANAPTSNDPAIGDLTPNIVPSAGTQPSASAAPTQLDTAAATPANAAAATENSSGNAGNSTQPGTAPAPAPAQVNEIKNAADAQAANSSNNDDQNSSSSKKKKKKGLKKAMPF
jgi:outer membrane protein assembly factor BamD